VCCRVLPCVAVCCSVLQCVAVCCANHAHTRQRTRFVRADVSCMCLCLCECVGLWLWLWLWLWLRGCVLCGFVAVAAAMDVAVRVCVVVLV